jgi:hypothetical protein
MNICVAIIELNLTAVIKKGGMPWSEKKLKAYCIPKTVQ